MTALIDWQSPTWGQPGSNVHIGSPAYTEWIGWQLAIHLWAEAVA